MEDIKVEWVAFRMSKSESTTGVYQYQRKCHTFSFFVEISTDKRGLKQIFGNKFQQKFRTLWKLAPEQAREGWNKWREGDADRQVPLVLFALAIIIIFLQFVFTILQFLQLLINQGTFRSCP